MKIAWFTDTYLPQMNGVVAYINDAVGPLTRDNDLILFAPGEGSRFRIEKVTDRFRIFWIPSSPFPFYEGYRIASFNYRRISGLLAKEKPDIVHAHAPINLGLQGMIAAKRKRIPVVVTYHTHFPDYVPHLLNGRLPGLFEGLGRFTAKKFVRHAFRMADVVAAPTHELAAELRSYGLRNVTRIPNGVDFSKLYAGPIDAARFRLDHGIPKGKKVALYLGRISFEKRLDKLLEAFRMAERPDRVLVVAGGGPYLKDFRGFARALGLKNVVFTGFIKETGPAYAAADIFASASDTETFGLTFVEAMRFGLPVVGVRRLGAKEVIDDGKDGILVEPGDTPAFARAMERLLSDPALCKKLGERGREKARAYSIENSVKETLKVYENLLKKR